MKKVYVFFADGFEEVEAFTSVDLLRRAGADVETVSVMRGIDVHGAHQIRILTDIHIDDIKEVADLIVLPGGMPGTTNLMADLRLRSLIKDQYFNHGLLGAICAAPMIFAEMGLLKDKKATSYPGCVDDSKCLRYCEDSVVRDDNIITSRGVGCAIDFALALIEALFGADKSRDIANEILYPGR